MDFGGGAPVARPRADIEPLTAELRRLHMTVSRQFLAKLDAARDGLSHTIHHASAEQVVEAALDLLLAKQARARGLVKRPRTTIPAPPLPLPPATSTPTAPSCGASPSTPTANPDPEPVAELTEPRHRRDGPRKRIPAPIRRAVWKRDGGRCSWPLDGGGVCGSTHRLELDHVVPWACWGGETVDDLRVACHAHNTLAARRAFGAQAVDRYHDGSRASRRVEGAHAL